MMSVELVEWESEAEFRRHFDALGTKAVLVGRESEAPRRFYSCVVAMGLSIFEVGVISSGLGVAPAGVYLNEGHVLIVGHDTWLTWISLAAPAIQCELRLDGVFFEFIPAGDKDVVAVHELGAIRVAADGGVAWRVDTDVVERFSVDSAGNLVLCIMDRSSPVVVPVRSGRAC